MTKQNWDDFGIGPLGTCVHSKSHVEFYQNYNETCFEPANTCHKRENICDAIKQNESQLEEEKNHISVKFSVYV